MTVKLEDMVAYDEIFKLVVEFAGLEFEQDIFETLKTPYNVTEPKNYPLTAEQTTQFWEICEEPMGFYGYWGEEYEVEYEHPV